MKDTVSIVVQADENCSAAKFPQKINDAIKEMKDKGYEFVRNLTPLDSLSVTLEFECPKNK